MQPGGAVWYNKSEGRDIMKYAVILCDGMADVPDGRFLGGRTPMELACKPNADALAAQAEVGLARTVPEGMKPGSDVANLSVMGYDPARYYTGRSPLEAVSMGVELADGDSALRCNLVTLGGEGDFAGRVMADYCAGDISSGEGAEIIKTVNSAFGGGKYSFFPGVSYRHCLKVAGGAGDVAGLTPPHDISGRVIGPYLCDSPDAAPLIGMMRESVALLRDHPVNRARRGRGQHTADAIWLWGEGTRPALPEFSSLYGKRAGVVSAVDLVKGIGIAAGMDVATVPGATGYIDTDYTGKEKAAEALYEAGCELCYIHIEAPDECGHRREPENKVLAIELIDEKITGPLVKYFGTERFRILIMPDHPTPLSTATHSGEPVPYLLYDSARPAAGGVFTEAGAAATGVFVERGCSLMARLLADD